MEFLSRAGFSVDDALKSLRGTLNLAQAGALGLGEAADIATNVLSAFNQGAEGADKAVDILAKAAASSNTNVQQLGNAFSLVGPVAAGFGESIQETAVLIGVLSNAGIQASSAGTGLRRVLAELQNPGEKLRGILDRLNLTTADVNVQQVGAAQALQALAERGFTATDSLEAFGKIGAAAGIVLTSTTTAIDDLAEKMGVVDGFAQQAADTMDNNLNGAFLAVQSAVEGFILRLGALDSNDGFTRAIRSIASGINFLTDNIESLSAAVTIVGQNLLIVFAGSRAVAMVSFLSNLTSNVAKLGGAAKVTGRILAAFAGPVGILASVAIGFAIFASRANAAQQSLERVRDEARLTDDVLSRLSEKQLNLDIAAADAELRALGDQLVDTLDALERLDAQRITVGGRGNSFIPGGTQVDNSANAAKRRTLLEEQEKIEKRLVQLATVRTQKATELFNRAEEEKRLKEELAKIDEALSTSSGGVQPDTVTLQQVLNRLKEEQVGLGVQDVRVQSVYFETLNAISQIEEELTSEGITQLANQVSINQAIAERASLISSITEPAQRLLETQQQLRELDATGLDTTRQQLDLELQIADLAAQRATTFDQSLGAELARQAADAKFAFIDLAKR